MSFNPANFPFTMPALADAPGAVTERGDIPLLLAAARAYDARSDDFARGKGATCRDIAAKLEQFGTYASTRQADYARNLIKWTQPRQAAPLSTGTAQKLPKLFALMQRLAKLHIGTLSIVRKNGDTLCWIKLESVEGVVGKIENGVVSLFAKCQDRIAMRKRLEDIEADPEAAAVLHGRVSGRCSICNRDLTDPESIERGIGPICAEKF